MIIIIDTGFICHTAYHAGHLLHKGQPTGIIKVFFETLLDLSEANQFSLNKGEEINFCFPFDSSKSLRKALCFSDYKKKRADKRKELPEDEKKKLQIMREQIDKLRYDLLPRFGFKNIFHQNGYESDDIMAEICRTHTGERISIVTSDKDLYQCLRPGVNIITPKRGSLGRPFTHTMLYDETGMTPKQWLEAKILWGCHSDEIPPIRKGIGEVTAAKYIKKELAPKVKSFSLIQEGIRSPEYRRNEKLIRLPFEGTKCVEVQSDELFLEKISELFEELEFKDFLEERMDEWERFCKKR